jgi:hypothetical protein
LESLDGAIPGNLSRSLHLERRQPGSGHATKEVADKRLKMRRMQVDGLTAGRGVLPWTSWLRMP